MTREEASFILANIDRRVCDDELNEALDMAIKALEQMPVTTTTGEGGVIYYPQVEGVTPTVISAGKQESSGDAIDRKLVCAFIDGLISDDGERKKGLEYIRSMPPVNPQPCEDAISRQAVLDTEYQIKEINGIEYVMLSEVQMKIRKMPPVTPQEPKTVLYSGDGYADGYMVYDMAECPNCGYEYEDGDKDWGLPFCPSCGQKLNWESEE